MATFRPKVFFNPQLLRSIEPKRLLALLSPYRGYLRERGLELPRAGSPPDFDNEKLTEILARPTSDTPQRMLNALYLIDEMSTPEGMDVLLAAAKRAHMPMDNDSRQTPADVAVQVWLYSPAIIEQQHARRMLRRPRRFDSFRGRPDSSRQVLPPVPKQIKPLEHDLDNWFESQHRGRGVRVFCYPMEDQIFFTVRRGEPYRREEALEDGDVASLFYRPLKYDTVVYDLPTDELRINASMKSAKPIYCRSFGKHLFGDPDRFPGRSKYTLNPLLDLGPDALACVEVDEIEWVKLVKVHYIIGGPENEYAIRGATDFFAALARRGEIFPKQYRMAEAKFHVKFADSKRPQTVRICPGNVAAYTRAENAERLEYWMKVRGFILNGADGFDEATEASVAIA